MSSGLMGGISTFSNITNGPLNRSGSYFYFPPQTVNFTKKQTEDWQHACMDFFSTQFFMRTKERKRKAQNYKLVNGEYASTANYNYGSQLWSDSNLGEVPSEIVHYPVCNLPLKTIWGEELKRPFNWRFKAEGEDNTNEYINSMTDMLFTYTSQKIESAFGDKLKEMGIDPNTTQGKQYVEQSVENKWNLDNIEAYKKFRYNTTAEKTANALATKLQKELRLEERFRMGWKDATIVAEEFYWTGVINDQLVCERKNPLNIAYQKSYEDEYIDESDWVIYADFESPSKIIDRYRMFLDEEQVKYISDNTSMGEGGTNMNNNGQGPQSIYTGNSWESNSIILDELTPWGNVNTASNNFTDTRYPLDPNQMVFASGGYDQRYTNGQRHFLVLHAEWQSKRKLGLISYPDPETGEFTTDIVDGEFKTNTELEKLGWSIEYFYINEPWEGTKIGKDIYVNIRPKSGVYTSPNHLEKKRLGYTGLVYNRMNARPMSFLDEMFPYQELYNIVMDKVKEDINADLGNILQMDISQIPSDKDWTVDTWMDWLRKFRINLVDAKKNPQYNQMTSLNVSQLNAIQAKLSMLEFLERKIFEIAGVSPQRMGTPTQDGSTTATQNNNAIIQSYSQTEDYFYQHNLVKCRVLQNLIEDAKVLYANDEKSTTYFLDDMSLGFLKISDSFTFSDLCVYPSDSGKDAKVLQTLESLAQPAMQNGASLYDISNILTSDNISEIKDHLKDIAQKEEEYKQQQLAVQKQDIEARQQETNTKLQFAADEAEKAREFEGEQRELDRENKLEVEEIKSLGIIGMKTPDADNNGVLDVVEQEKSALERMKLASDVMKHSKEISLKKRALDLEENKALKGDDIENKKINLEKQKVALEKQKMTNDLKIAKIRKPKTK